MASKVVILKMGVHLAMGIRTSAVGLFLELVAPLRMNVVCREVRDLVDKVRIEAQSKLPPRRPLVKQEVEIEFQPHWSMR